MKIIFLMIGLLFMSEAFAGKAASSSNAVSAGSSEQSGVSSGPLGPVDAEEKEETRERARSMGGAPNAGAGTGTGTGAGTSVGPQVKGEYTAGAEDGDLDD